MNLIFLVLLFVIPLSSAGKPDKERKKHEKQANIEFYKDLLGKINSIRAGNDVLFATRNKIISEIEQSINDKEDSTVIQNKITDGVKEYKSKASLSKILFKAANSLIEAKLVTINDHKKRNELLQIKDDIVGSENTINDMDASDFIRITGKLYQLISVPEEGRNEVEIIMELSSLKLLIHNRIFLIQADSAAKKISKILSKK